MKTLVTMFAMLMFAGSAEAAARSDLFPQPTAITPAVDFWTRVYTEITTSEGFIHDSRHLGVVYETFRLPTRGGSRTRAKATKAARDRYGKILRSLATGKRTNLSSDAQRVLALWPDDVTNKTLSTAARRLRFQLGQANKFREGLIRSGTWMPYISKTLSDHGLPHEIAALPHVESSFNPEAASHAGAAGLWQFTRSTGRRFMRIDHVVDARRDPYMSSVSAAQLLEQNYATLGHWPLALTAYNHGVSGMRRAVRRLKTNNIDTIIARYQSRTFGFASRNFYPAFLAAVHVDANAEAYFGVFDLARFVETTVVSIPEYLHVRTIGNVFNVSRATLRQYNPALKETVWTGKKYVPQNFALRLPTSSFGGDPIIMLASLPPDKRFGKQQRDLFHRVRRGDTLSAIATRYGVRLTELVNLNGLNLRQKIYPGQRIHLPTTGRSKTYLEPVTQDSLPGNGEYIVRPGDSISRIAQRFSIDEHKLLALNPMRDPHALAIGHILQLPPKNQDKPNTHISAVVAPGQDITKAPQNIPESLVVNESDEEENVLATAQSEMAADPSDYASAADETIEVQARETLGHYADWLKIRTQRLRNLNHMDFGEHVVIGKRLRLDFSRVADKAFERDRLAYHQTLQEQFFDRYHIDGTHDHKIQRGESVWTISQQKYHVPVWLLRQYNPDLTLDQVHPGTLVKIPKLTRVANGTPG